MIKLCYVLRAAADVHETAVENETCKSCSFVGANRLTCKVRARQFGDIYSN